MARKRQYLIYVAEFDEVVDESIAAILRTRDIRPLIFSSGQSLAKACKSESPDGAMIDCDLPDIDVLDMLDWLTSNDKNLSVFLLSAYGDVQLAVEAIKRGAKEFIEKPFLPQTLFERLDQALRNADQRKDEQSNIAVTDSEGDIRSLPARQMQILIRLVHGEHNKQIAYELGISERTVETHRARMMKRLGVHSLAELITLYVNHDARPE